MYPPSFKWIITQALAIYKVPVNELNPCWNFFVGRSKLARFTEDHPFKPTLVDAKNLKFAPKMPPRTTQEDGEGICLCCCCYQTCVGGYCVSVVVAFSLLGFGVMV